MIPMLDDVAVGAPLLGVRNEALPSVPIAEMESLILKTVERPLYDNIVLLCC